MKFASLKGGRDGQLLVVSRDTKTAVSAAGIADTMQACLDNWDAVEPQLQALYAALNEGKAENAFPLDLAALGSPLPRAYQYLDGACYISHIRRNREARGDDLPGDILDAPLIYQGISHGFLGWNDPIQLPSDDLGIDFEAEIAAITGEVPLGVSADEAASHIRLFTLLQDTSLRALVAPELKRTFGFLTSKPRSALGPIAVTPDELGDLWDGNLVSGTMRCTVRGEVICNVETGIDTPFDYGDAIAHVAKTRPFEAGTIIGLGTVSNEDDSVGCACIGEYRALETIKTGNPTLGFLKYGETFRIELLDRNGETVFGAIEQTIQPMV